MIIICRRFPKKKNFQSHLLVYQVHLFSQTNGLIVLKLGIVDLRQMLGQFDFS
jgi:hypothetical protein